MDLATWKEVEEPATDPFQLESAANTNFKSCIVELERIRAERTTETIASEVEQKALDLVDNIFNTKFQNMKTLKQSVSKLTTVTQPKTRKAAKIIKSPNNVEEEIKELNSSSCIANDHQQTQTDFTDSDSSPQEKIKKVKSPRIKLKTKSKRDTKTSRSTRISPLSSKKNKKPIVDIGDTKSADIDSNLIDKFTKQCQHIVNKTVTQPADSDTTSIGSLLIADDSTNVAHGRIKDTIDKFKIDQLSAKKNKKPIKDNDDTKSADIDSNLTDVTVTQPTDSTTASIGTTGKPLIAHASTNVAHERILEDSIDKSKIDDPLSAKDNKDPLKNNDGEKNDLGPFSFHFVALATCYTYGLHHVLCVLDVSDFTKMKAKMSIFH